MIAPPVGAARRGWRQPLGAAGAALLLGALALLQTSVFPYAAIAGVRPAAVLMAAAVLAAISDDSRALRWAFGGGLFVDLLSAAPLGVNALLFPVLVYVVGGRGRRAGDANAALAVLAGAAAAALYYPALVLALQIQGFPVDWGAQVWERLPRAVAVNAGAALALYPVVHAMERWTGPIRGPRFRGVQL